MTVQGMARVRGIYGADAFVAILVVVVLGLFLAPLFEFGGVTPVYLIFIVATVILVRSVPVEPGAWLRRRRVRRTLVAAIVVACVGLAAAPAVDEAPLVLALALFDVILGRATQRIPSAPDNIVDERQEALRNRAHAIAYWILAAVVLPIVVVAQAAGPDSRQWLQDSLRNGGALAFFELLFFLPAMAFAWLEADVAENDDHLRTRHFAPRVAATVMVTVALGAPVLFAISVVVLPVRTSSFLRPDGSGSAGVTCEYFGARSQVGVGEGASLPMSAEACWDGKKAFENWGMNRSDCSIASTDGAFVETIGCSRTTGADGTLRFVYAARVRPAVLPFLVRDVRLRLTLARDGRVLEFP